MLKNIEDLRRKLAEQFEKQFKDAAEVHRSKELANIAGKMIKTAAIQIEYAVLRQEAPKIQFLEQESAEDIPEV